MGHYAYEVQEATTLINKDCFNEVLSKIKEVVSKDKWRGYGWRSDVLNAQTLEDVAREFNIQLTEEGDGYYRPVIDSVYVSIFFDELIHIVTPYMTDGEIKVDNEYGIVTFVFEDGTVRRYDE